MTTRLFYSSAQRTTSNSSNSKLRKSIMVVQAEQIKPDEQCPLLQMDSEGGVPQSLPTVISPGWKVACVPKRSWFDRWPDYISACWMTLILLGITFIVFYALGMSAYRRKSVVIVKCQAKPENNVFFHHLLARGSYLQLPLYSDYLSNMAVEYPLLHIHVFFLVDDSLHNFVYGARHSSVFKRYGSSIINNAYPVPMNEKDKQEIQDLQQRYRNINITIMSLSQYMAMTPLRYKWKMIPIFYLPFYARVFAVWEYGGIGLDLTTFNNKYHLRQNVDRRITAILKQHNDGIEEKKYIQALNIIDRGEENEIFKIFYNLITNIFNNTFTFFDNTLLSPPVTTEKNKYIFTVSRNYRNRQENEKTYFNSNKSVSYSPSNKTNTRNVADYYSYSIIDSFPKNVTNSKDSRLVNNIIENSTFIDKNKKLIDDQNKMPIKVPNFRESNLYNIIMTKNNISKQENKSLITLKNKTISNDSIKVRKNSNLEKNATKAQLVEDELFAAWTSYPSNNVNKVWETLLTQSKGEHNKTSNGPANTQKENNSVETNKLHIIKSSTDIPHVVLLYDFSMFSDGVGPSYFLPDIQPPIQSLETNVLREPEKNSNKPQYFLSITSDGNFVAATSRHHPFLSHLLSSGCKRVNPRFAIEDTIFSQCSGFLRNDVYCDNIYILE